MSKAARAELHRITCPYCPAWLYSAANGSVVEIPCPKCRKKVTIKVVCGRAIIIADPPVMVDVERKRPILPVEGVSIEG